MSGTERNRKVILEGDPRDAHRTLPPTVFQNDDMGCTHGSFCFHLYRQGEPTPPVEVAGGREGQAPCLNFIPRSFQIPIYAAFFLFPPPTPWKHLEHFPSNTSVELDQSPQFLHLPISGSIGRSNKSNSRSSPEPCFFVIPHRSKPDHR